MSEVSEQHHSMSTTDSTGFCRKGISHLTDQFYGHISRDPPCPKWWRLYGPGHSVVVQGLNHRQPEKTNKQQTKYFLCVCLLTRSSLIGKGEVSLSRRRYGGTWRFDKQNKTKQKKKTKQRRNISKNKKTEPHTQKINPTTKINNQKQDVPLVVVMSGADDAKVGVIVDLSICQSNRHLQ